MEVSGLHASAALTPEKELPIPSDRSLIGPTCLVAAIRKTPALAGNQTTAVQPVAGYFTV
jgi:hypothetical protein